MFFLQKKYTWKFAIGFLMVFSFTFFYPPHPVFALVKESSPIAGVDLYSFKSDYGCSSKNPKEQSEHFIIVPSGSSKINRTYIYFHGLSNPPEHTTKELMCHGYLNLCDSAAQLQTLGLNVAIIGARLNKAGSTREFRDFNTAELNCFLNKASQELTSLGRGYGSDLILVGHSAGGRSIKEALNSDIHFNGLTPSMCIFLDPCYGDWCDVAVKSNKCGSYVFYGAGGPGETIDATNKAIKLAANPQSIRLVQMPNGFHSKIPRLCFTEHVDEKACQGNGTVIQEGILSSVIPIVAGDSDKIIPQATSDSYEKLVENILSKTKLETETPGYNPNVNIEDKVTVNQTNGKLYLNINTLSEYIGWLYQYSLIAITIIAVVIVIYSGVQWMVSGGNSATISEAKKRIGQTFVALLLALGSYTILYAINPKTTKFGQLNILVFQAENTPMENESLNADAYNSVNFNANDLLGNIKKPNWDAKTFDCSKKDSYSPAGVLPSNQTITYTCDGMEGNVTSIPQMKVPLCRAAEIAKKNGYTLQVRSSYRPFEIQVKLWCEDTRPPEIRRKFIATPGFSNHGHGVAIDVFLYKNGKQLTLYGSSGQCKTSPRFVKEIADIFYLADPNFVRLETEIWHFEYGTMGTSARNRYDTLPQTCTGKPSGVSNVKAEGGTSPISNVGAASNANIIAPAQSGQSPAAQSNQCTFTEKRWNTNTRTTALFRKETNAPYNTIISQDKSYVSKSDPRCSVCEQDQVLFDPSSVGIRGVSSVRVCWAYVDQIKQMLKTIVQNNQLEITSLVGYRPNRTVGAVNADGFRTGAGGHFYGMAIDINAEYNGLYSGCSGFDPIAHPLGPITCSGPSNGGPWNPPANPNKTIYYNSPVYRLFTSNGWKWGATNISGRTRDFMHFSIHDDSQ
ncbi:MAG: hypothetical protein COV59_04230 [Candidatus Magasanikbacteria bacterium CG11_big_fil_rev_8_21_14_0_20_39_34]|uniref:Peptidase M15C domain-containing protein n=1 Tax=Candidatus Magasanikbacteria bacterium CG11_big_fil_rev_8_21_14_0_20_39_34 TaxID=1974653 RepID=A0A2H0N4M6_9BACT|nr:MAG: hypothetical protein COV59_04230 [Candidatus Magasanikbacteria bacterium CG11_big_fil_rev_8_21_14_0_20_39_34]